MNVCTIDEIRSSETLARSTTGLSVETLLENAAHAVCDVILHHGAFAAANSALFVCGQVGREPRTCSDSTGIAGAIAARHAHALGFDTRILVVDNPTECRAQTPSLNSYVAVAQNCDVPCTTFDTTESLNEILSPHTLIVDAILNGSAGVTPTIAELINAINTARLPVLSIGVPSGVCANTGAIAECAINALVTIAFGSPLRGCVVAPGATRCGDLLVTSMSLPRVAFDTHDTNVSLFVPRPLRPRLAYGHKGTFGDTLFIAGAGTYYGAPVLAAMASLKSGAGYARLACPASMVSSLAVIAPELVFVPQHETEEQTIAESNADALIAMSDGVDFVVIGPGVSTRPSTQSLVQRVVSGTCKPVLIDGDGLTAMVGHADILLRRRVPTVLTPHAGEMARLLQTTVRNVVSDPIEAARTASTALNSIVVLKGHRSVVASPDGRATVNTTGNDGMGTAGSGDVLTGVVASMVGLGMSVGDAVRIAVFIHGLAGDLAMACLGADGMTARDILGQLPAAMRMMRNREDLDALVRANEIPKAPLSNAARAARQRKC